MIIQSFLGKFINNYFLDKEIRYHTQFSEKSYNAVINITKTNKYSMKSFSILNSDVENLNLSKNKNITTDNNNPYIEKVKSETLLIKHNNTITQIKPINKILKKMINKNAIKDNKKMIEDNSNINILNSNKNNNIKYHSNFIFKKKTKKLSEYKQFIQILDYYVIYQIIKDVNILKLLCLNNITAQIFYKYRHRNINVSNLDYIMEKETRIKVNTNLNDDNSLFNNINEKLILLNSYGFLNVFYNLNKLIKLFF